MKKRHAFLEQLERRQEAAKTSTAGTEKDIGQLSLEELQTEEKRLQWELTKMQIEDLAERRRAREMGASSSAGPHAFVPRKQVFTFKCRTRPSWK